jgi:hypothetical protein
MKLRTEVCDIEVEIPAYDARFGAATCRSTVRERMPHTAIKDRGLEHGHGVTLLGHDILDGRRNVLWLPQPSRAPMACPSLYGLVHPASSDSGGG